MGEIVNLRLVKKRARRAAEADRAMQNRAKFGRTGAEKLSERHENSRQTRALDGSRLDGQAANAEKDADSTS